ncbi:MAG: prolipoprotein diacylglyceryl transferase [Nostocoides sp.]
MNRYAALLPVSIPSPTVGAFHVGPLVIRAYALCILAGIVIAVWLTGRRLEARGSLRTKSLDIAAYAVPFGILGGRAYHVATSWQPYFGKGGHPIDALKIWHGGLGIWGAVALGAFGAWLGCRRFGVPFLRYLDSAAPGVVFAQALGRWGNWFNNELYGRQTSAPWGLTIHQWDEANGRAVVDAAGKPVVLGTFQPTFLYESVFLIVLGLLLLRIDRVRSLRPGQLFALYVAGYPLGRVVMEFLRSDEANHILGLRVNVWTSLVVFLLGVGLYARWGRPTATRPEQPSGPAAGPDGEGESVPETAPPPPDDHDVR